MKRIALTQGDYADLPDGEELIYIKDADGVQRGRLTKHDVGILYSAVFGPAAEPPAAESLVLQWRDVTVSIKGGTG